MADERMYFMYVVFAQTTRGEGKGGGGGKIERKVAWLSVAGFFFFWRMKQDRENAKKL